MRVLLANTSSRQGGADIAVFRLADALGREGADVRILLLNCTTADSRVLPNPRWMARHATLVKVAARITTLRYRRQWTHLRKQGFSPAPAYLDSSALIDDWAEVVNLHWINNGHFSPEGIGRIARPVVWTAHDMWPITGGCHHSDGCMGFRESCGACPILGSSNPRGLANQVHERKRWAWENRDLSLVTPSRWLGDLAAQSSLFAKRPVSVIPNPLDLDVFRPEDKVAARAKLGLPVGEPIILFAATNRPPHNYTKGFEFLRGAMNAIARRRGAPKLRLAIAGADNRQRRAVGVDGPVHLLGVLDQARMIAAYAAADVVVLPSRHDNLPNVAAEALACGRPIVGSAVGGIPELIDHGGTGYLAKAGDVADLAEGLLTVLDGVRSGPAMGEAARAKAEKMLDPHRVARRYLEVYRAAAGDAAARHA